MIPTIERGIAMSSRRLGPVARGIASSLLPNLTAGRAAGTAGVGGIAYLASLVQSRQSNELPIKAEEFSTRVIATAVFRIFGPTASMLITGVGIGLFGRTVASGASNVYQKIKGFFRPNPPAIDN